MKKNIFYTIGAGAWIGGTMMTVPGVSGGSMAMILGIYDRLIGAVNGILKKEKRKESLKFLGFFVLGAIVGLLLFAQLVTFLLDRFPAATSFFFFGAVAGGAPMIIRSAQVKKFSPAVIICPIVGIAVALGIGFLPTGLFEFKDGNFWMILLTILFQIFCGVIISIPLVLPGISFSQVLYILGIYKPIIDAVSDFDIMALVKFIPLGIGLFFGIFIVTHVIEIALTKAPTASYLTIFGFILGSLPQLFPKDNLPTGWGIPICIVTAVVGFVALYFVSKKESA